MVIVRNKHRLHRIVRVLSSILTVAILPTVTTAQDTSTGVPGVHDAPNVIFILIDDQGWTDLSGGTDPSVPASSSDFYETPNIDALAARSLRFTNGYSPSPICSPSRASLLTGKSPQALGFTDILESRPGSRRFSDLYAGKRLIGPQSIAGLPEEEVTIADAIRDTDGADYATAHFGKWHVGGGGPGRHGFEAHDGATGNHNLDAHAEDPNPKDVFGITGRAVAFMHAAVSSDRPFYMQLSHYANHVPLSAMDETVAKYRAKPVGTHHTNPVYAALNENLDSSVGQLLRAVERLGIADNTYIIYASDNGGSMNLHRPVTNNAPLRKGKTWVYEGGIRVPFMIAGPDVEPGVSDVPVIGWDVMPTVCGWIGCKDDLPRDVEGGDLAPLLTGQGVKVSRRGGEALVWHFPHYLTRKGTTPHSTIRIGDYKMVKFYHYERVELYDLSNDLGETQDLSANMPERTAQMEAELANYLQRVGAAMPVRNTMVTP